MAKPAGIKPLTDSEHVRLAVHSDPGKGKSRFAGSSEGKVLILTPPFEHLDSILKSDRKGVERWVVPDWDEMNEALDYLRHDGPEWDWVWLDSISLWQDAGLDDIWETIIAEKPARARYGLDQGDYGINMMRLARWVRHVVGPDLFNFGVTAHSEQLLSPDKDEDGDPILKLMPFVQGKQMANKICGYMNVVTYLNQNEDEERILHTTSSPIWYGKNQFSPDGKDWAIKDPTMTKLMARIEKERTARTPVRKKATTKRRTRRPTRGK